jgi:hypothetical protein
MARVATARWGGRASENFGEAETITEFRNRSCPGLRPRVGAEADAEVVDPLGFVGEAAGLVRSLRRARRSIGSRGPPTRSVSKAGSGEEVADEATALLAAREIGERLVERRGVPVRRAPLVVTGGKLCDEPLLPVFGSQFLRVREEFVVTANGRQGLSWVQLADVTGSPRMVRVSREGAAVRHTSSLCTFGAGLRRRVPR